MCAVEVHEKHTLVCINAGNNRAPKIGSLWSARVGILIRYGGCCREAGRPLFVSFSIKTGFTVILNSSSTLLSSHFLPCLLLHFYSCWLLPTSIKHYNIKTHKHLRAVLLRRVVHGGRRLWAETSSSLHPSITPYGAGEGDGGEDILSLMGQLIKMDCRMKCRWSDEFLERVLPGECVRTWARRRCN